LNFYINFASIKKGTKFPLINFPKGKIMLRTKNKLKVNNINKTKHTSVKTLNKNPVSSKQNKKNEFHRSLEAFSDCV
tara:strand:- start:107 stop:337 length:231 start_codon:yes stop_codon:yes gene_type:complete